MQPSVNVSILSIIPGSMKSIKTDILYHMTNAARTITARKWRKTIGHTIMEWICEMNEWNTIYGRTDNEIGDRKEVKAYNVAAMGKVLDVDNETIFVKGSRTSHRDWREEKNFF